MTIKRTFFLLFAVCAFTAIGQQKPLVLNLCNLQPTSHKFEEVDYLKAFELRCSTGIEGWSKKNHKLVSTSFHPFVEAVHDAYAMHRPLVISPDMVWLMVAQGFAKHVD